jgi:type 1 fimbriae regulatory protein FimB/type 1 fimbriae regulatory protein FimE
MTSFDTVGEGEMSNSAVLGGEAGERPTTESGTVIVFPKASAKASQTQTGSEQPGRREWLTEREIEQLREAARKRGRYGHRDTTMVLIAFRHGLRVSELVALQWNQIDLEAGRLQVIRRKGSDDSVQPLSGVEIRALRRIKREQEAGSRYVFLSERGAPMTANGFFKMLSRAAESIGMDGVHPHLLRHATGFYLVNRGTDTRTLAAYLGHRQIANTARYTKMDALRFDGFWQD